MTVDDLELINIRPFYCRAETWPWKSITTDAGRFAVENPGYIDMPDVSSWFDWTAMFDEPFPAGKENRDGKLVSVNFKSVFTTACRFMGTDRCLVERPDLRPITKVYLAYNRRLLDTGYRPTLILGDDVAHNIGMMMSPAMWREWIAPEWRRFTELAREYGVECWLHSDGDLREILDEIKALGFSRLYKAEPLPKMLDAYTEAGGCDRDYPEPIWEGNIV